MDWSQVLEGRDSQGNKVSLTLAEIEGLLTNNLSRSQLDEFGGRLIIFAEFGGERCYA